MRHDSLACGRASDFEIRRKRLAGLSDEELKERFWELAREIVEPLVELAYTHTSPSIERSVLLRMGFSSLEAQAIVSSAEKRGLLGKGIGRVLLDYAARQKKDYLQAGRELAAGKGWDEIAGMYGGESQ
jgi:D-ornithine 4,5-aminomutase subunit alpha